MPSRHLRILATAALLALSAPAMAAPSASGAGADSGANFLTGAVTAAVQGGQNRTFGGFFASYGSNGSYLAAGLGASGNYGGVNYVSTFTSTPTPSYYYAAGSRTPLDYASSSLTLYAPTVTGTPTFNAYLFTGGYASLSNLPTAYSTIMANSVQLTAFTVGANGTATIQLPSSVVSAINGAATAYGRNVTLAFVSGTGSGGGVGAPGPVAGAGLPFLVAAGLAYLARRRSGTRGATA